MADQIALLERQLERQTKLVEASYALHTSLDLDELLGLILDVAASGVRADRGTVFLVNEDRTAIWSRVLSGDEKLEISLPMGRGIAGTVAATGQIVRIDDAYEDERFDRSWDEKSGYRTREILCAPIRNRDGEIVGVFQLLNRTVGKFTAADEEYLNALSVHAALAIENAYLHASALEKERYDREVRLAQDVQRQLQPERQTIDEGVIAVAGINELCEDATGDYYDVLMQLPGERVGVAIGDVSGHGLQAALVMAEARAFLRAFMRTAATITEAMGLLNDFLVPDMKAGKFISMFAAVLDTETASMSWCNAGHNPPLVRRADGSVEELGATGTILGILPNSVYKAGESLTLGVGDVLLLYTDGVTEARNSENELFGDDRLRAALDAAAGGRPEDVITSLRDTLRNWAGSGQNEDDITMVCVARNGQ